MSSTRSILETIRTADAGSLALLDAVDAVNSADWYGDDGDLVEKADRIIAGWDEGEADNGRNVPRMGKGRVTWPIPVVTRESEPREGEAA